MVDLQRPPEPKLFALLGRSGAALQPFQECIWFVQVVDFEKTQAQHSFRSKGTPGLLELQVLLPVIIQPFRQVLNILRCPPIPNRKSRNQQHHNRSIHTYYKRLTQRRCPLRCRYILAPFQ